MAAASFLVLTGSAATVERRGGSRRRRSRLSALACLAVAVTLIASAGVSIELLRSSLLLALGLAGLGPVLHASMRAQPAARLFPSRLFDWRTTVGSGMTHGRRLFGRDLLLRRLRPAAS